MNTNSHPQHYYEWGSEKPGFVSVFYYSKDGVVKNMGTMLKSEALKKGLTFENPYA